jgi:pseudoazurin
MQKHLFLLAASLLASAGPAAAADHTIQMLNKGANGQTMVFEPSFLKIAPGDAVTFVPTDKSHDSESIPGMIPDGAAPWKGKINQETRVTFTTEGIYGFKCSPHYAMGMTGLIQVGDSAPNLEAAKAVKQPPMAKRRFDEDFKLVTAPPAH